MNILELSPMRENHRQKIEVSFPQHTFVTADAAHLQAAIDAADVIIGNPPLSCDLYRARLRAVLLDMAGSDRYCAPGVLHPDTRLANASGSYGVAISEQVIGMIIALCKNFRLYDAQMAQRRWERHLEGCEMSGSRVCIVGYGDIGAQTARRLKAFGCHITAVKRRLCAEAPFADRVVDTAALDAVLPESDIVMLALPQNRATMHLFDRERLLRMKRDAILVNVGRGSAIVTEDLIEVMQAGHLYGAALDVVDPEPLPADSALWDLPNVLLTSHSSGGFMWESVQTYFADLVVRNLRRLETGEALENEVDRETGYRRHVRYECDAPGEDEKR